MYNIKETYSVIWKWFIDHVLPAKTVNITVKSSVITVMLIFLFALPLLLFSYLLFPYSTVKNETEEHILLPGLADYHKSGRCYFQCNFNESVV